MPRYYRKRYTRVIKPKKKWATNIKQWTYDSTTAGPDGTPAVLAEKSGFFTILSENSAQGGTPTPVILKTGNYKVQLDVTMLGAGGKTGSSAYVLYLPEGTWLAGTSTPSQWYEFLSGVIGRHPEWILSWKQIGLEADGASRVNFDKVSFSSRLKRNLNSGDAIILCVLFDSPTNTAPGAITLRAISQYWTCAN